jgi:hypothetical protein
MVGGDDHGPLCRDVLPSDPAQPEVDVEERLQNRAHQPVDGAVYASRARALMELIVTHHTLAYPLWHLPLQLRALSPGLERTRTLRGAVSGSVAAAVCALEQPLDKFVFSSRYDDIEVVGKALVRGEPWYPAGLALHLWAGATFGAAYANVAPALPLPPVLRGPAAALVAHLSLWPLGTVSDRFHPARKDLPTFAGNRRAFAQATWRRLLFGIVLGELERRLNAVPEPAPLEGQGDFSSNGHGSLEHAVSAEPT